LKDLTLMNKLTIQWMVLLMANPMDTCVIFFMMSPMMAI
jgi:hypothetical protein